MNDLIKDKTQRTLNYQGRIISKFPSIDQFVSEQDYISASQKKQINAIFNRELLNEVSSLYALSIDEFIKLGISKSVAIKMIKHLHFIKQEHELIIKPQDLIQQQNGLRFLSTGITELDRLFTYPSGHTGLRSKSLIEIYGEAASGKTQLMLTLMVQALNSSINQLEHVLFIDTENSFDIHRVYQIAEQHHVDKSVIDEYLLVAKPESFDQLEFVLQELSKNLREYDLSLLIIDSIIDPLKAQYPIGEDMENLQIRQQHLKQVTDQLKSLSIMHNFVTVYTNQVRADIEGNGGITPQGGHTLSHCSDVRLYLRKLTQDLIMEQIQIPEAYEWRRYLHQIEKEKMKLSELIIVDSGYLAPNTTDLLVGELGVTNAARFDKLLEIDKSNKMKTTNYQDEKHKQDEAIDLDEVLYS